MINRTLRILLLTLFFIVGMSAPGYSFQSEPDTLMISKLLEQADENVRLGNYAEARQKVSEAAEQSDQIDYQKGKEVSIIRLADIYLNEQFYDSAQVLLEDALERFPQSTFRSSYQNLLATSYRYQNKLTESIELYNIILAEVDSSAATSQRIAAVRLNLASAYSSNGNKIEAIRNYLAALDYAKAEQDTHYWAVALNNLGDTYNGYEDYERAEFYLQKSIELSKENGLKGNTLRALMNLANTKTGAEEAEEALKLYEEALVLHREIRPSTPPFQILYNLGNLFLQTEDYDKAEQNFKESLGYCRQFGIPQGIYYNLAGLGNLESAKGDLNAAEDWFSQAVDIAEQMNANGFMMESYEKLYELNKKNQQFEDALLNLESFHQLSDSLRNLEMEREFAELESTLELLRQEEINELLEDKQEQQERRLTFQFLVMIVGLLVILLILYILYKANRENKLKAETNKKLRQQQAELEKKNDELNQLFAIIAHDLKSPLSSIQGLLYLIRSGELSTDEVTELFTELEKATERNLNVMEELFSWARDRMSGIKMHIDSVEMKAVIDHVINNQQFIADTKGIKVVNEVVEHRAQVRGSKNALTMVFRNLLSNSLKFTDSGGTITFTSEDKDDFIEICIEDTGTGMSEDLRKVIMSDSEISISKKGTMGENGTGFGLSLVKEFVQKMGGYIQIESEEGKGTTFCIALPAYSE